MKLTTLLFSIGVLGVGLTAGSRLALSASPSGQVHRSHYGSGQLEMEVWRVDGRRHGPAKFWYADGSLKASGEYMLGEKNGLWECWTEDGALDGEQSGLYEQGHKLPH